MHTYMDLLHDAHCGKTHLPFIKNTCYVGYYA